MQPSEKQYRLSENLNLVLSTPQHNGPEDDIEAEVFLIELLNDPTSVRARCQMLKESASEFLTQGIDVSKSCASHRDFPKEMAALRSIGIGGAIDTGVVSLDLLLKLTCDPESLLLLHQCVLGSEIAATDVADQAWIDEDGPFLAIEKSGQKTDLESDMAEELDCNPSAGSFDHSQKPDSTPKVSLARPVDRMTASRQILLHRFRWELLAIAATALVSVSGMFYFFRTQSNSFRTLAAAVGKPSAPPKNIGDDNNRSVRVTAKTGGYLSIVYFFPRGTVIVEPEPSDAAIRVAPGRTTEHRLAFNLNQIEAVVAIVTPTQADSALLRAQKQIAIMPKDNLFEAFRSLLSDLGYNEAEIAIAFP